MKTDRDEGISDGSRSIKMTLEHKRKDRKHATEKIDGHERERDTDNRAVLIYLIVLRSSVKVRTVSLYFDRCQCELDLQEGERDQR